VMMRCDRCSARAIIYQRYSGMSLCRVHFYEDVHRKIRETLRETRIFCNGAKIAIALNGGAEGLVLLCALKRLSINRPDIRLFAVLVDEGIKGYRPRSIEFARRMAAELEVPFSVKAFRDAFSITMDELAAKHQRSEELCRICESRRNDLLNRAAVELCANVVATGHSLDAEASDVMLSYLQGKIEGLLDPAPNDRVPVIRPLRRIPARELMLYAKVRGLPFNRHSCHYACGMRECVRGELLGFEMRHPGTNYSLQASKMRMKGYHLPRDGGGQSL
jgi:tRNA(Ile)-lysidine synthase TilS/MesJ